MAGSHTAALQLEENERVTFMRLLTHDDRNSYYVMASASGGTWAEAAYKASALPYVSLNENASCYVTHNGFTRKQRKLDQTRQINALFFDLDCHTASMPEARGAIAEALRVIEAACDDFTIPTPTMIVDSGRGIHLYYVLDRSIPYRFAAKGSVNEKGIGLFHLVERQLADVLDQLVAPIAHIEVDRKVFDFARVSRIPGTYNEAAGCFARLVSASEMFHDLSNLALWKPSSTASCHAPKAAARKRRATVIDYQPLMLSRLVKVAQLQEHRGFDCSGNRELMCFVFYNTAVQIYSRETAAVRLSQFNQRFLSPIPQSELTGIRKSVDRVVNVRGERGHYLLGAQKIIELLGMTTGEMIAIDFFASKRAYARAAAKRDTAERKKARNQRIVELYATGKHTQAEVAHLIGCSERTVASVLKQMKLTRSYRSNKRNRVTPRLRHTSRVPARSRIEAVSTFIASQPRNRADQKHNPRRRSPQVMSTSAYAISERRVCRNQTAKKCPTSLKGVGLGFPLLALFLCILQI